MLKSCSPLIARVHVYWTARAGWHDDPYQPIGEWFWILPLMVAFTSIINLYDNTLINKYQRLITCNSSPRYIKCSIHDFLVSFRRVNRSMACAGVIFVLNTWSTRSITYWRWHSGSTRNQSVYWSTSQPSRLNNGWVSPLLHLQANRIQSQTVPIQFDVQNAFPTPKNWILTLVQFFAIKIANLQLFLSWIWVTKHLSCTLHGWGCRYVRSYILVTLHLINKRNSANSRATIWLTIVIRVSIARLVVGEISI